MNRFYNILDKILETLLFLVLAAMCTAVVINIFCRFILHFSLGWADELAQILLVWLTFLGAALAMRDKAHYTFAYLVKSLPKNIQLLLRLAGTLLIIAMTCALLYWSAEVSYLIRDWVMTATHISRAFVYSACPIGCCFLLIYMTRDLVRLCRQINNMVKNT